MSQLKKVQQSDYQILYPLSGKTLLCKKGNIEWVCKELNITKKTIKEVIDDLDQMKIKLPKYGVYFPEYYWEGKQNLFLLYKRLKFSMADLIKEHKRKGQYIPMGKLQSYVNDFTNWLGKIHQTNKSPNEKFFHCRIKPSNLFEDIEENECVITDFYQFSNENLEVYLPLESITALKKNQSQRFQLGNSMTDALGGDPQKVDIWQLGISFLEMATLKNVNDLLVFRDTNVNDSPKAIEIKEICKKNYGIMFVRLIEKMLVKNPAGRPSLIELDDFVSDFVKENAIQTDENQIQPQPDLLLEEMTDKVQRIKNQTLTQYLLKYQLQPVSSKIKSINFWEAVEDIGIKISFREKGAMIQQYDLQKSDELDLSSWAQKQKKTIKLGTLTFQQDQNLNEMMKEMNDYIVDHQLQILDQFKIKDTEQDGYLQYEIFDDVLKENNLGLQGDDAMIVKQKYDPEKKNIIYYENFCQDLGAMNQKQIGVDDLKKIMYKEIRERHNVFIQFFRTYDEKSKGHLEYNDLNKFLNDIKQHPSPDIWKQLITQLDPENKQTIMFENMRRYFQDLVNQDVVIILNLLITSLVSIQMTFPQLIRSGTKSSTIISQTQLLNSIKQMNNEFKKSDFLFLMSVFGVRDESIEYQQFIQAVLLKGKELKVKNWQQLSEMEQIEDKPRNAFDDPESSLQKSIVFNAKQFESQKKLLQFIYQQLQQRQQAPKQYFKCTFSRMPINQYKEKIRQLEIYKGDYEIEQEELLNNLLLQGDSTQVDVDLLIEAIMYFKDKQAETQKINQYNVVMQFTELNKQMKRNSITYQDIQDLDALGDGTLRKRAFADYCSKKLSIDVTTKMFKDFIIGIEQDDYYIILEKIRIGLRQDDQSTQLLQNLNQEIAYGNSKPEQLLKKYDANRNTKLELREFSEFLQQLVGNTDQKLIQVLFYKFDTNGDGKIDLVEFKKKLQASAYEYQEQPEIKQRVKFNNDKSNPENVMINRNQKQLTPQIMKSVFRLKDALKENNETLEIFDKKKRGQILVNAFQDEIIDLGFDFSEFKQLSNYLQSPEDQRYLQFEKLELLLNDCDEAEQLLINLNQIVQEGKVQIGQLFYNYDRNGDDVLQKQEFQTLVKDIDSSAKPKLIDNLFLLLDSNQDGTLSINEFKQKITTKEKPKLIQKKVDLNQNLLSNYDDVIQFIQQSPQILGEFEIKDEMCSNKLDLDIVLDILIKNKSPPIQLTELKKLAQQLNSVQGNQINYRLFYQKTKNYKIETSSSKAETLIERIREQLTKRQLSVIQIANEFDIHQKGRIKVAALKMGFADHKIQVNDEEWNILFNFVEQDAQDYFNYQDLNDLIYLGLVKYREIKKSIIFNAQVEIEKIVGLFKIQMEKQICTLLFFFRSIDADGNSSISSEEFNTLLLKTINYSTTQSIQKQLFEIFDMDKDGKINFTEFEYQVYKKCEITAKQISEMKTTILNGRNPNLEQHLSELFSIISQGNSLIDFRQFVNYANQFKKYDILDLDQLFRLFDKEYQERLDLYRFILEFKPQQQTQLSPYIGCNYGYQNNNCNDYQDVNCFQPNYPQQNQGFPQELKNNQNQNLEQYNLMMQDQNMKNVQPQKLRCGVGIDDQQYQQNQYGIQQNNKEQIWNQQPQNNVQFQNKQNIIQTVGNPMESKFSPNQSNNKIQFPPQNQYNQRQQFDNDEQQWIQSSDVNQGWQQQTQGVGYNNKLGNQQQQVQQSQTMIPINFDLAFYDNELNKKCIQKNVDLFDLLCQFDRTALPELKIQYPQELEKVFLFLDIQAPTQHIQQFFYYYSQQTEFMSIVHPYLKYNNSGKLLAKALNFTMVKHKEYTKQSLWTIIGGQSQNWGIAQLGKINQSLKIGLRDNEVKDAFQYWDNAQQGYITYKIYDEILTLNQIVIPNKDGGQIEKQEVGLQSTLDSFLMNLSEVVLSKNCFNLFEQADKKGYNQIPYNDFIQISKKLLGQIQTEEIIAIKQLFQVNGFVNLSDLANRLRADRKKQQEYNFEDEKKKFGIADQQKRKSVLTTQNQEKFKAVLPILNNFLKKRGKNYEDLSLYFFPANSQSTLDKNSFIKKSMEAQFGLTLEQSADFYDYLDANFSGQISINEFRLVFQTKQSEQIQKKQAENIIMSQDIEDEIKELFKQIDENGNQQLDQKELLKALQSIGLNPSTDELKQYFQQFDKDNSGTISYQEFSVIVKDILRKELLNADDLLEDLRREFRQVCNPTTRMLSKEQMNQVFNNMGVQIKPEELDDLFNEIDEDKSNSVDIDEFIFFIQKNQSGMSAKASAAIMNIKGTRRISLHDLKQIFLQLPNNFIMSFTRGQNKKLQNLPSSSLKPVLDSCGFYYQGLNYVEASNFNIKQSILDKVNVKNNYAMECRLIEATGVPIPDEKELPRNTFIRREIGIILIDKALNKFDSNAIYTTASWNSEYEDRWIFDNPATEQAIILRWGTFDEKMDNMTEVVFEFITYSVNKGKLIQISCAYGSIPVNQLKPGKQIIELKGGAPLKEITIDKKDIRANRTGWRSVVKALSSNIKSQLVVEVTKLAPSQNQKILALPNKCLLNKWALGMQAGFREYFAYRTQMKGEIELNLQSDVRIKAWLNLFDCPDACRQIGQFWNEFIEPKVTDHQFLLKAVAKIADCLYLMFKNTDFKFSTGDPTCRIDHDNLLFKRREELVKDTILDIKVGMGILNATNKKQQVVMSLEPLNVEELMDLDNEQDQQAIEKFLNKKKQKKK